MIKLVSGGEFDVSKRTVAATKLGEDDYVVGVMPVAGTGNVVLQTKNGYFLKFSTDEIPEMKKNAIGARGMKLGNADLVENAYFVDNSAETCIAYKEKQIVLNSLKLGKRDGKGVKKS